MKTVRRVAAVCAVIGMLSAACGVAGAQEDPFAGRVVVRAKPETLQELRAAELLAEDVWSCAWGIGRIDVMLPRERLPLLAEAGVEFDVMVEDVAALIAAERAQIEVARRQRDAAWFNTFRDLTEINDRLDMYLATYPALTTAVTIGQSLEGRPIRGVRISAPDTAENPRDQRPVFVINATQHAREWAAPMAAMWRAETLLEGFVGGESDTVRLMEGIDFVIIPVVNADGYEWSWSAPNNRLWRKNRRGDGTTVWGVDLNRNWSFQWGGPGSSGSQNNETYRGPEPFSEPESTALRDFLLGESRLRAHLDIHTHGQLLLSPWGYTMDLPPDADLFRSIDLAMRTDIYAETHRWYDAGPAITTIYQTSGSIPDWVYGDQGVPSWTIELRDQGLTGFVLPSAQIIPTSLENAAAIETIADWMLMPVSVTVANMPPAVVPAGQPVDIVAALRDGLGEIGGQDLVLRHRRVGAFAWIEQTMIPNVPPAGSRETWFGRLPAEACGTVLEYEVVGYDQLGRPGIWPMSAAAGEPGRVEYASPGVVFSDDFEVSRGWTLHAPGSTASRGAWERADPQETEAQPGGGSTNNGRGTLVTGRARGGSVGANDVDDGVTIALSPVFDLSRPAGHRVVRVESSFDLWYNNSAGAAPGEDPFLVEASSDGGLTWMNVLTVVDTTDSWTRQTIRLDGVIPLTGDVRLRMIAQDLNAGSIVEAVVDEFRLVAVFCPRGGDFDGSGGVDGDDITAFFAAWEAGLPSADFDESGGVDGDDITEFIAAWQLG